MDIFDMLPGAEPAKPEAPICSRKGCRAHATTQLLWNNPKIHTAERRKIWLACTDHAHWLEDYLKSRSLWKETLPLSPKDSA
ncbi:hypothetical protein [Arthrobacter sp.]|uniref:hypothetical protein n=1 Tax=Arthrobacter sp. TaxID=1667 RepID=UPI0026DEAE9F|nr:hypothetical protein [Arthrobacter sp.]MDO5753846.1 hypothetical protein [Arthrobacter sp.]